MLTVAAYTEAVGTSVDFGSFAVDAILFTDAGSILVVSTFAGLVLVTQQVDNAR